MPTLAVLALADCSRLPTDLFNSLGAGTPQLRELVLEDCCSLNLAPVGARDVQGLALLTKLERLDLLGSNRWCTDASVRQLDGLSRLRELGLGDNGKQPYPRRISDAALAGLRLPALEKLDLKYQTTVTDAGLQAAIEGSPRLRKLRLWGCKRVTPGYAEELCEKREGLAAFVEPAIFAKRKVGGPPDVVDYESDDDWGCAGIMESE